MSAKKTPRKGESKAGRKALRWIKWAVGILVSVIIKVALIEVYNHVRDSENGPGC